jgi:hypothetical protein
MSLLPYNADSERPPRSAAFRLQRRETGGELRVLPVPQRGKAAVETAEYAKYAEVGTQSIPYSAYSAYSAVPFVWEVARRLGLNWSIAVQSNPGLLQPEGCAPGRWRQ